MLLLKLILITGLISTVSTSNFYWNYLNLQILTNLKFVLKEFKTLIIKQSKFLLTYYHRNELLWVDGFLLDFLQKKSIDIFLRKFIIYTGFLFSERLVFDYVVRIYLDNIIWPMHYIGVFESNNVIEMLSSIIFLYFLIFSLISLIIIILI